MVSVRYYSKTRDSAGRQHQYLPVSRDSAALRPLEGSPVKCVEHPNFQSWCSVPDAADYIVNRLRKHNLALPDDQPRILAEIVAKGCVVFYTDLERTLTAMVGKFPDFRIDMKGVIIEPEPANLKKEPEEITAKELESKSSLALYLRDMGCYRQLTREEEVYFARMRDAWKDRAEKRRLQLLESSLSDLTARQDTPYDPDQLEEPIDMGLFISSLSLPDLNTQQKQTAQNYKKLDERYIIRYKSQLNAIKLLVTHNLRLVVGVAKYYSSISRMPLTDLISEGSAGLALAAYKFNHKKGNKFSTFAVWLIRKAVTRAICNQHRSIRLPVHQSELMASINKCVRDYREKHKLTPTPTQIAEMLGKPVDKIIQGLESTPDAVSLDQQIMGDSTLEDFFKVYDPRFEEYEQYDLTEKILNSLIDPKNRYPTARKVVICLRYGLAEYLKVSDVEGLFDRHKLREKYGINIGGGRYGTYLTCTSSGKPIPRIRDSLELTLEEVGELMRSTRTGQTVSRERARQIEERALERLRHPSRSVWLEELAAARAAGTFK